MKRILAIALLCAVGLLFPSRSQAQATIAVSASKIQGLNGGLMVSGSLCFQATDQNNFNIGIQVSGGGVVISTPFCTSVNNGAISTFNVPNPSTASPLNTRYRITVTQGARTVSSFPIAYLCNQSGACTTPYTFNFDNCLSSGACVANPIPIVSGPAGPPGPPGGTLNWRGAWSSGSTYAVGDGVSYNGGSYYSILGSNTNNQPDISPTYWGILAASGTGNLTTDNIFTMNNRFKGPIPWRDITAYMPAGGCSSTNYSDPPATGTISSSSSTLALSGAADFLNGCGIAVLHAGATSSISVPSTGCTISTVSRTSNVTTVTCSGTHALPVGYADGGGWAIKISGVSDSSFNVASAPILSVADSSHFTYRNTAANASSSSGTASTLVGYAHGITGATTYNYKVVAIDSAMGTSAATAAITITNGNATLSRDNYNWIAYSFLSTAYMYGIYSDKGLGGAYSCVGVSFTSGYSDYGLAFPCPAFLPSTPPGAATAQTLNTTISAGGGSTSLTLAATASNTATAQNVYHDDSSFINSCLTANYNDTTSGQFGTFGCLLPAGGWNINGALGTATGSQGDSTTIFVAGDIHLNTVPIFFRNLAGYNHHLQCIGGSGGVGQFSASSSCNIIAGTHLPAVFVIQGATAVSINNFTAQNLYGHGIYVGASPTESPASYNFDHNIIGEYSSGAGTPLMIDSNVIGVWANGLDLTSATSASGLPSIMITGQMPYGNVMCCMNFDNLSTNGYGPRIDQPGGNESGGGTNSLHFSKWVHESLPASAIALVNHDQGPNAPNALSAGAPISAIDLRNVNNSDPVSGPASYSVFGEFGTSVGISSVVIESVGSFGNLLQCGNGSTACATQPTISGLVSFNSPTSGASGSSFIMSASEIDASAPFNLDTTSTLAASSPAMQMRLPPPNDLLVASTGSGSLSAATYTFQVEGLDAQATPGRTLPSNPVTQTVGASSSITLNWYQGQTSSLYQAYSGYQIFYCTGANCTPNNSIAVGACGGIPCSYVFTSTSGFAGDTLATAPTAYLSWLKWASGATPTNSSCILCSNARYGLGIGDPAPPSVAKLSVKGGDLFCNGCNVDGTTYSLVTTGTTATLGGTYQKTLVYNEEATAAAAVTYTLPTAVAGKIFCAFNANSGGTPDTGVLTLQTSAAGQYIVFSDGSNSASGGYVSSSGAAGDAACVAGIDSTHWQFVLGGNGTAWTKH